MTIKFEIEHKLKSGINKSIECFVFAKCLDLEKEFTVTDNSYLSNYKINNFLSMPRAKDKNGNIRLDVFLFKIRFRRDFETIKVGQIVELIDKKEVI